MAFTSSYGRPWYNRGPRPSRSPEDEEYYDLRLILRKARKNQDTETIRKVLEKSDLFFENNPEYRYGCWGSNFYT
jgi:hypothetical protein